MPEILNAVMEAFCHSQGTDVFRPVLSFITEGLLAHFFCYHNVLDSRNILWFLEHVNEQEHILKVQLPQLISHLSLSLSSRSDSEDVQFPLPSSYSNTHDIPLTMLKYYLLRILGSCNEDYEGKKQWVPPYETEVNYSILG